MTNPSHSGTNSGGGVTGVRSSVRFPVLPRWWAVLLLTAAWLLVHASVNSASVADDLTRRGVAFDAAEPWIWEFSSAVSLLIWLLPVLAFDEWLRTRWPSAWPRLVAYAGASTVFCVAHVTTMVAMRHLAYRIAGWRYDFGAWPDGLLYEYRKDVLTFAMILVVAAVWRRLASRPTGVAAAVEISEPTEPAPAFAAASPIAPTFIVRTVQGDLLVRADEVDWVEAQGNYVALHVGSDTRLLRQTLADMETRLKDHGFIRTHRRALVNRLRMQAIIPPELGDLGVRLSSGQIAPLSESRRSEVVRLVLRT